MRTPAAAAPAGREDRDDGRPHLIDGRDALRLDLEDLGVNGQGAADGAGRRQDGE
jgi:hypothetical protein